MHDPRAIDETSSTWRTTLSYSDRPLDYVDYYGQRTVLVGGLTQLQVGGAHVFGPVRIGVDVPLQLHTGGAQGTMQAGLGSIRVDGQYTLFDGEMPAAAFASVHLPTGDGAGSSLDAPLGASAGVVTQRSFGTDWSGTAQLGAVVMPEAPVETSIWGSRMRAGLGVEWRKDGQQPVIAEWILEPQLGRLTQVGSELLVASEFAVGTTGSYTIRPAVVAGLSDAPGSPRFRVLVQARREVLPEIDADGDGLIGDADLCPEVPEDEDGWEDTDGCPEETSVTLVVKDSDGFELVGEQWAVGDQSTETGSPLMLPAGPIIAKIGLIEEPLEVPQGAPVVLTVVVPAPRGDLMVQAQDRDGQPIAGATWSAKGPVEIGSQPAGETVPVRPGLYTLTASAEGYRPAAGEVEVVLNGEATLQLEMLPARAVVRSDRIDIKDSVYFETSRATIKTVSYALLDEVAELLRAHPEVKRIRIEGHTDSRGGRDANQKLSQARAEAVRTYLIQAGVDESRLTAVGYGEDKPLDRRETPAAWEKNRRVDFFVEDGESPE
jgi:outer membrane protein OmpA-like peptidoglycan-associated protein